MKTKEDNENFDKIKVFTSNDEKLKILGELLSNKSSRDIIRLLIEKEMYANEIAKKLEIRPNLVIHHLQKMKSIGLLEITNKKIIRKGSEHKFFRIPYNLLIAPNESIEIKKNGFLKKIFKDTVKICSVFFAGVIATQLIKIPTIPESKNAEVDNPDAIFEVVVEYPFPYEILLLLAIPVLIIFLLIIKKKKKRD